MRQYTLRSIPPSVDDALRRRAAEQGKSLNQVAVEALQKGLGVPEQTLEHHDLDHLAGVWVEDPAFDKALKAQDVVDEDAWR